MKKTLMMKKIVPLLAIALLLVSCACKNYQNMSKIDVAASC